MGTQYRWKSELVHYIGLQEGVRNEEVEIVLTARIQRR